MKKPAASPDDFLLRGRRRSADTIPAPPLPPTASIEASGFHALDQGQTSASVGYATAVAVEASRRAFVGEGELHASRKRSLEAGERLTIRLPEALLEEVKIKALRERRSLTDVGRELFEAWVSPDRGAARKSA